MHTPFQPDRESGTISPQPMEFWWYKHKHTNKHKHTHTHHGFQYNYYNKYTVATPIIQAILNECLFVSVCTQFMLHTRTLLDYYAYSNNNIPEVIFCLSIRIQLQFNSHISLCRVQSTCLSILCVYIYPWCVCCSANTLWDHNLVPFKAKLLHSRLL